MNSNFKNAQLLLSWYDNHARELPWRIPPHLSKKGLMPDPYHTWLSEIMLQQTTIASVKPYFTKFIKKWPSIQLINAAQEDEVMSEWAGLGYYSRARNLIKCANIVCEKYSGYFPQNEKELLKLPGIGPYTAAAISAIAFGKAAAVVDGNIERVISRLFFISQPIETVKNLINEKAKSLTPNFRSGDYSQAMMDIGSTICIPKNPKCNRCPLVTKCIATKKNNPDSVPVKLKKKIKPIKKGFVYIGIINDKEIMLFKRPKSGLLGGMLCLPSTEWKENTFPLNTPPINSNWTEIQGEIKHSFTHFTLLLKVMITNINSIPQGFQTANLSTFNPSTLPTVMKKAFLHGYNPLKN